ncbi:unnamed protein product [Prunus armeniaca]
MSSRDDSKALSFEAPLYLWGGSLVPNDVQVKLLKSQTDNKPLVDVNDRGARIITFRPFYFSLGFKFPLSKLFKEVFYAMECAPSQCTPNVYRAIMCFENLSRFFTLELTVREFFYFFEVRHFERYAQVRVYKTKLFDGLMLGMTTCWKSADGGRATLVTAHLFPPPIAMVLSDISKQLELGPDMAKVDGGLPLAEDVERWKQNGPDGQLYDYLPPLGNG